MKSLRKRIITGSLILALIMVVVSGWAVLHLAILRSSIQENILKTKQGINAVENMMEAVERLDSAQLLFLLGRTGQAENIITENSTKFTESLQTAKAIITDSTGQERISNLEENYLLYLASYEKMQSEAVSGGDPGSTYSTESFPIFQSLSDDIQGLLALNQEKMQKLTFDSVQALRYATYIVIASAFITIVFSIFLAVSFLRSVLKPLHLLVEYILSLRSGKSADYDEKVDNAEFAELNREFSRVARTLRDYERYYKNSQAMDEKAKAMETAEVVDGIESKPVKLLTNKSVKENIKIDIQDVSVLELVETAVATLKPQANAKDIRLLQNIPEGLPEIEADANKVLWVLTNLIGNALRFTQSGGQVIISARALENQVYLSVSDTGIGMPKEYQEKIFDRFVQAKGKDEAPRGTGLGLSIAREIVQAHQGQIWVESEKEKGATFTFTIPVKTEDNETETDS